MKATEALQVLALGGLLALPLTSCGGPAGDGGGVGGSSTGGAVGTGGTPGSGGLGTGGTGTGGANTGGTNTGGTNTGGTNTGEIDIYDLGTSCDGGQCPTGLTPLSYEICGVISCETECDCHLPCADSPEICPEGSSCSYAPFIDEGVCLR